MDKQLSKNENHGGQLTMPMEKLSKRESKKSVKQHLLMKTAIPKSLHFVLYLHGTTGTKAEE
jgi:hypothetical protein